MKKALGLIAIVLVLTVSIASEVSALEPFLQDRLEWNMPRIEGEISYSYHLFDNQPVKLGKEYPAIRELDLKLQARIFQDASFGKLEFFSGVYFLTNEDAPDAVKLVLEAGYTIKDLIRIEAGVSEYLNIGSSQPTTSINHMGRLQPGWGGEQYWLGVSGKFFSGHDYLVTGYFRYYLQSYLSPRPFNVIDVKDPLQAEYGLRAFYRPHPYVTLFASGSVYLDKHFEPVTLGFTTSARYNIGEHLGKYLGRPIELLSRGLSVELSGNTKILVVDSGRENVARLWSGGMSNDFSRNAKGPAYGIEFKAVYTFK